MLVHEYVRYWARRAPDRVCVADGVRSWTYAEVDERANRFAAVLAELGVRDGDRFAVLARNRVEWAVLYAGGFAAGAVAVPLNYRHHPREWVHPLTDSGATVVVTESRYADAIDGLDIPGVARRVLLDGECAGWHSLDELLEGCTAQAPVLRIDPEHTLYQMYTSGTTGLAKGALLSHRAADANMTQIRTALSLTEDVRNMLVMPLFHTASAVNLFAGWTSGLAAHLVTDFEPERCAEFIEQRGITMASLAPAMIQAMLVGAPSLRERDYRDLRAVLYGASAINEQTLRAALEVFDCDFYQAYGQTEATAALTMLGPEDHRRALAGHPELLLSCGRPVVGTQVQVVDEHDAPLPPGRIGEIRAAGPQLMSGYVNLPAESVLALRGGWLYTGDAGYLDEDGLLYVADRVKDMIVTGAENVFPKEIEDVLYALTGVAEAAVIGVPSQRWGEEVKALVVPVVGVPITEESVIDWCRSRLAGYKCPKTVDLVPELPRTAAGKVLKRVLREPYWRDHARQVG